MKKIICIAFSTFLAVFLMSSCNPDKEEVSGSSSQETPPIVSEISSVVSPPVYEESSAADSSSEDKKDVSPQVESQSKSSSLFAAE